LFTKRGKATSVTVNGRLVVTFNEVGLAAAVAGLGLVSMTVGAARKEISEGLLVRVLADWDMGEVELHAVFPARKAAKPSAPAFVDLLASSTVMIFPTGSQLRSEFPRDQRAWRLFDRMMASLALTGQIPAKMLVTRNLTVWSAASYSTRVARNDRFGCVA
jgi:hypothetical protein